LALHAHTFLHRNQAGLRRRHAIDNDQTIEAHTHHAKGRTWALMYGCCATGWCSLSKKHGGDGFTAFCLDGLTVYVERQRGRSGIMQFFEH
jgi:hypothetical protein